MFLFHKTSLHIFCKSFEAYLSFICFLRTTEHHGARFLWMHVSMKISGNLFVLSWRTLFKKKSGKFLANDMLHPTPILTPISYTSVYYVFSFRIRYGLLKQYFPTFLKIFMTKYFSKIFLYNFEEKNTHFSQSALKNIHLQKFEKKNCKQYFSPPGLVLVSKLLIWTCSSIFYRPLRILE